MRAYWSDTNFKGEPIPAGTFCRVIDLEDGTHPIFVYGATQAEVWEKIERQNTNAQIALNRSRTPSAPPVLPQVRTISAEDVMQATADLDNPAKSGRAVATLIEHATGVDPVKIGQAIFAQNAMEWEKANPEFYPNKPNRQLVGARAIALAGGKPAAVTSATFDVAFSQMKAEGMLAERPAAPPQDDPNNPNGAIPAREPGSSSERPRGERFSTGVSGNRLTASQAVPKGKPKYTEYEIRTMKESERQKVFNDPDYIAACEFHYGSAQA